MRNARNQIVVHAGQVIDRLCYPVDGCQVLIGKDVAFGEFNTDHQNVGAAKIV